MRDKTVQKLLVEEIAEIVQEWPGISAETIQEVLQERESNDPIGYGVVTLEEIREAMNA